MTLPCGHFRGNELSRPKQDKEADEPLLGLLDARLLGEETYSGVLFQCPGWMGRIQHLWHRLFGGSGERCPSLADSVRGPDGHRRGARRRRVLMLTTLALQGPRAMIEQLVGAPAPPPVAK
jgi:hypothetical protein